MNAAICAALLGLAIQGNSADLTLSGVVTDSDGKPVPDARVGLAMAVPRTGPAMFCPSCYLDCAKSTNTDAQGRFEIPILDSTLKFQVLCTASNKKTKITPWYDPSKGPLDIKLDDMPAEMPPERTIRGQVVNAAGVPLPGVLVDPHGAKTATRRWWGGGIDVDPAATDKNGSFVMLLPPDIQALDISCDVEGYAGITEDQLTPGAEVHKITMPSGAQVRGRMEHNGEPIVGLELAVVQLDRGMTSHFIKAVSAKTDENGAFVMNHLPANQRYAIFTCVAPGNVPLVLTTKKFSVDDNGKLRNLGSLDAVPSLRLAGKVELPEGARLPKHAKLSLDRDPAWDLVSTEIHEDGTFEFTGLPPEVYELRLAVKGFTLDPEKLKYQVTGEDTFGIPLNDSIDDVRIALKIAPKKEPAR